MGSLPASTCCALFKKTDFVYEAGVCGNSAADRRLGGFGAVLGYAFIFGWMGVIGL